MNRLWLPPYWFLRYFIPLVAILLTLRAMYLTGIFDVIIAVVFVCIYWVAWFFSGGVPSAGTTLFVAYLVFYLAFFWFLIFPPASMPDKIRGRQLRSGPGKSKFTSRASAGGSKFTTRTTQSSDKKGFRS